MGDEPLVCSMYAEWKAQQKHAFTRRVERKPSEGPCDLCGLSYSDPIHGLPRRCDVCQEREAADFMPPGERGPGGHSKWCVECFRKIDWSAEPSGDGSSGQADRG